MKTIVSITMLLAAMLAVGAAQTPDVVQGKVVEKTEDGQYLPVIGASVYWLGTGIGTLVDTAGRFSLPFVGSSGKLAASSVGYRADTINVKEPRVVRIILMSEASEVATVEVVGQRSPTYLDYQGTTKTLVMTEKELFKAACCNLSESFETNPSVDVSFTDAVTGTRQIEMLGLAGTYSQITVENMPAIRGLTSNVGLTYIPGTWIENIQVSKGVGSVANGYESITGQINVEYRKPWNEEESRIFLNVFGNQDQRFEANLNLRQPIGEALSSLTLLSFGTQRMAVDENRDRFLDIPTGNSMNLLQRFSIHGLDNIEGQLLVQYTTDEKRGGTERGHALDRASIAANPLEFLYRYNAQQLRVSGKTGYVFPNSHRSVGLQWSYADYRQSSLFNVREYDGRERTGYVNLLYDVELEEKVHRLRFGVSYLFDEYDETYTTLRLQRTERVPGAFAEYTYTQQETFSAVIGLRADNHNLFGAFVTPRLHIRYTPDPDWVFRAVAGRGQRTGNMIAENVAHLASARTALVEGTNASYPFEPEIAWNFGFNVTRYFLWDYREGTLTLDVHRTSFENQLVVNLDRSPQQVVFQNLAGASYSNSIQMELTMQPVERLELRTAYRFLDVQQNVDGQLRERPFVARHRAFVNFGYSTERTEATEPQMLYDLTVSWFGQKRLPDTRSNPADFQAAAYSPSFFLVNGQVTRSLFEGLDLYIGVENLLGFRQDRPIISANDPSGAYFDSSLIWGPVTGRMVYGGLRWRV